MARIQEYILLGPLSRSKKSDVAARVDCGRLYQSLLRTTPHKQEVDVGRSCAKAARALDEELDVLYSSNVPSESENEPVSEAKRLEERVLFNRLWMDLIHVCPVRNYANACFTVRHA